jgi:hypothetical protein
MDYRLNANVAHSDFLRARSSDLAHVEQLAENGELLYIGNIAVDVPNIVFRRFLCDTRICVTKRRKNGKTRYSGSCCTDLVVEVSEPEQQRIERLAELYLKKVPKPDRGPRAAARRLVNDNVFVLTDKQEPILDDFPANRCILSWMDKGGRLRCSLNSMCIALHEPIAKWKLDACYCYPLHYVDYEPSRWFLTVVCRENYRMLGAAKEAATRPCLLNPPKDAPRAYRFLRGELEHLWGKEFWQELDIQARRLLED